MVITHGDGILYLFYDKLDVCRYYLPAVDVTGFRDDNKKKTEL